MKIFRLIWGLLPPSRIKNRAARLVGFEVHPSARVHVLFLFGVERLKVGSRASIGAFTTFRGLRLVDVAEGAIIGQLNWISAAPEFQGSVADRGDQGVFRIGREAALTNRHYVDASGGVTIGPFATVAGVRTTIITHGIDAPTCLQSVAPVTIGEYALVSSNVRIGPGGVVPSFSLIAMGATVARGLSEIHTMYAGVPARAIRTLPVNAEYFSRVQGPVRVGPLP